MCRRTSHLLAGNGCEQRRRDNMDELGGSGRGDGVRPPPKEAFSPVEIIPCNFKSLDHYICSLDVYLHVYLVKRNLQNSAKAFQAEGNLCPDFVGQLFISKIGYSCVRHEERTCRYLLLAVPVVCLAAKYTICFLIAIHGQMQRLLVHDQAREEERQRVLYSKRTAYYSLYFVVASLFF